MIFISYYTPQYKEIAFNNLIPSLAKYNLINFVEQVNNLGNWYKNTAYKALFIKKYLEIQENNEIVWIDVDATIEQYPVLFFNIPKEYDIAFHYLDWNTWYGYKNHIKELLTVTMFFRKNEKIINLCDEWYSEAFKTNEWEQKVLQRIIPKYNLKIYELPIEYCYMKTRPRNQTPLVKCEPVIIHHQASREMKKKIK